MSAVSKCLKNFSKKGILCECHAQYVNKINTDVWFMYRNEGKGGWCHWLRIEQIMLVPTADKTRIRMVRMMDNC